MTSFKLSAIALATTLLITGCGGDDSSNNSSTGGNGGVNVPTLPPTNPELSELDQAKELIRTAHLFVSDSHTVETAYKNASDILTNKQQSRVSTSFDLADDLFYYMEKTGTTQLSSSDIIALQQTNQDFNDNFYDYKITPNSDFIAKLDNDGTFTMSGTGEIVAYDIDYPAPTYKQVITEIDRFTVSYDDFEDGLTTHTSTTTPELTLGFKEIKIGTGNEQVLLTSATNGAKLTGTFNKAVVLDDEFDLSEEHDKGVLLEEATLSLKDLKLVANDSVVEARDFVISAMDISNKLEDGSTVIRTIPYKFALTGDLQKQAPKTDVEITLNMTANSEDIKKYITIDENDDLNEADNKYVGMTVMLSVKGDVTKEGSTTIPLDFQAHLERSARDEISLKGLTASVEGKTLFIEGKSDLDTDYNAISSQLTVKQNKAYIILNVDSDNEFVVDGTGKLGDIMVGNKDYGDLLDNDGKITARFTDNSIITL